MPAIIKTISDEYKVIEDYDEVVELLKGLEHVESLVELSYWLYSSRATYSARRARISFYVPHISVIYEA